MGDDSAHKVRHRVVWRKLGFRGTQRHREMSSMTKNQALAYGTDYTGEALRPGDRVVVMNGPYAEMGGELGAKSPSADGRTRGVVVFDDGQVGTSYLDLLAKVADKPRLSPLTQALEDWQETIDRVNAATAKLQAARDELEAAHQAEDEAWKAYKAEQSALG